jgi:hypothetical protein
VVCFIDSSLEYRRSATVHSSSYSRTMRHQPVHRRVIPKGLTTFWRVIVNRTVLPLSRHLPIASTDGSLTKNLNKTGVRLWTESSVQARLE